MNYINLTTKQYPVTESDIRAANPNTSYPQPFPVPDGYALVFPTPQPTHNAVIQAVQEIAPELTAKGTWEQRWTVVPRFTEYTDEQGVIRTVAEQEAAAIAADRTSKATALKDNIEQQTQKRLDDFAKTRNYDSILSACTYATSSVPKFQAEGQYCVVARDETWATLYTILAEVEAGVYPMPTSFADIEPELPALVWP